MREELEKILDNNTSMLECKCGRHIENIIVSEEFNGLITDILNLFNKTIEDSKDEIINRLECWCTPKEVSADCSYSNERNILASNFNNIAQDIINIIKKEVGK